MRHRWLKSIPTLKKLHHIEAYLDKNNLRGLTQAKIIQKIGDFISASQYDHMM